MSGLISHLFAAWCGGIVGVFIACAVMLAKRADEETEGQHHDK